jgi:hypothetical protein
MVEHDHRLTSDSQDFETPASREISRPPSAVVLDLDRLIRENESAWGNYPGDADQ